MEWEWFKQWPLPLVPAELEENITARSVCFLKKEDLSAYSTEMQDVLILPESC